MCEDAPKQPNRIRKRQPGILAFTLFTRQKRAFAAASIDLFKFDSQRRSPNMGFHFTACRRFTIGQKFIECETRGEYNAGTKEKSFRKAKDFPNFFLSP
jgi:hypothetical protein